MKNFVFIFFMSFSLTTAEWETSDPVIKTKEVDLKSYGNKTEWWSGEFGDRMEFLWWAKKLNESMVVDKITFKANFRDIDSNYHVLLMNHFKPITFPPDPNVHTRCVKVMHHNGTGKADVEIKCDRLPYIEQKYNKYNYRHRYVVIWMIKYTSFNITSFNVYAKTDFLKDGLKNARCVLDYDPFKMPGVEADFDKGYVSLKLKPGRVDRIYLDIALPDQTNLEFKDRCLQVLKNVSKGKWIKMKRVQLSVECLSEKTEIEGRIVLFFYRSFGNAILLYDFKAFMYEDSIHKTDIAYGRPAFQSNSDGKVYVAGNAVDGKRYTETVIYNDDIMMIRKSKKKTIWWAVDLGKPYFIYSVDFSAKSSGFKVSVNVELLESFEKNQYQPTSIQYTCSKEVYLSGNYQNSLLFCYKYFPPLQYVAITSITDYNFLLQSVKVLPDQFCPVGYFGEQCRYICNCIDGLPCLKESGKCFYGCKTTWRGKSCNLTSEQVVQVNQCVALFKPAYQVSTESSEDQAYLGVDGDDYQGLETCSQTAWNVNAVHWWVVDLIEIVNIKTISFIYKTQSKTGVIVIFNDYHRFNNPPNPRKHKRCRTIQHSALPYGKFKLDVYCPQFIILQYVALVVSGVSTLAVCNVEVKGKHSYYEKDIAAYKNRYVDDLFRFQEDITMKLSYFDSNGYKEKPIYFTVDLGKAFLIKRVSFHVILKYFNVQQKLYLLLMNDIVPNLSKHDVIWQAGNGYNFKESVSGLIRPLKAYRYVSLLVTKKYSVYRRYLRVYEHFICRHGLWGDDCSKECHCSRGAPCSYFNGKCEKGCQNGWSGVSCGVSGCQSGRYGKDCSKRCRCKGGKGCDYEDGSCWKGCEEGWEGTACDHKVTNHRHNRPKG